MDNLYPFELADSIQTLSDVLSSWLYIFMNTIPHYAKIDGFNVVFLVSDVSLNVEFRLTYREHILCQTIIMSVPTLHQGPTALQIPDTDTRAPTP